MSRAARTFLAIIFVGFVEDVAAFGMADDYAVAAGFYQHGHRDFAGECAFFFPVRVLGGDCDGRASWRLRLWLLGL